MDDLRIIELYFNRDEQAIKETDTKYGKLCHGIAYNILNNHEDFEECVYDTYDTVWNTSQEEYVRNVFIRKYFYFDSIREIAKCYSFTESKVKNMLFYTRNKLKDYLIKEGVEI